VEAFADLPEELAMRARLQVIGKPYMNLAPLQTRIERLGLAGRITIEPRFAQDEEVPGLFGSNTVAVLPYREIEASGVLSVAIRQNCPILAARLGGFAETVTDGLHGLLVPPGDAVALTAAMVRFLAEPDFVVSCARAVRALSEKIPDWAEIARQTVAVYNEAEKAERDLRLAPHTRTQ
jgi:glycosyltransferase involved in cell wall biosynthesis